MHWIHLHLRVGRARIAQTLFVPAFVLSVVAVATAMFWLPATAQTTETNLYETTVALPDRSQGGQSAALQLAMREILGRVTGRAQAADEPALSAIVIDARRYVQQYRVTADGQFFVSFDGRELEKRIAAADPSGIRDVVIAVSGIDDLAAYAAVNDYLESLRSIRTLAVEQLSGDVISYRVRVSGDIGELARAIEGNSRLRPAHEGIDAAVTGALSYQYQP